MGSKDKFPEAKAPKSAATAKRKSGPPRRRTRMFALEPRVLFDGALVADIVSEAGNVADAGAAQAEAGASQDHAAQAEATDPTRPGLRGHRAWLL